MQDARNFMQSSEFNVGHGADNGSATARRGMLVKIIREGNVRRQTELVALLPELVLFVPPTTRTIFAPAPANTSRCARMVGSSTVSRTGSGATR